MKTPTVEDSKPKRDKLGPTGPANITDEETKKGEETRPKDSSYESDIENILDRKRAQKPPG
jgi:hypothetical protein